MVCAYGHGDNEDNLEAVHRTAQPGGYYAGKLPPAIAPIVLRVLQCSLRLTPRGQFKRINRVPTARQKQWPWLIGATSSVRVA